jgi:type IV pilus assembly protein PilE
MIIAILAAIAFPSYTAMMQRTRRAEAATIINEQQLRLEKHRVDNASYDTYVPQGVLGTPFYTISISAADATSYQLTAAPQGAQVKDDCGDLVMTYNAGVTTRSADADDCW